VDAVEAAVRVLEDLPQFNAGTGSVLTQKGTVEMDALIVDGRDVGAGAVAGVRTVQHPISLARRVMEETKHVFLIGDGAEAFAHGECGIPRIDNARLVTQERRQQLARAMQALGDDTGPSPPAAAAPAAAEPGQPETCCSGDHDTVGAVALDCFGNVAAATSTGGLTAKMAGRVGDSPLCGAGAWADNAAGAVSITGTGEFIIRSLLAKTVADCYSEQRTVAPHSAPGVGAGGAAVAGGLERMHTRIGGPGAGCIFVSPCGEAGIGHSTRHMSWALGRVALGDNCETVPLQSAVEMPRIPLSLFSRASTSAAQPTATSGPALRRRRHSDVPAEVAGTVAVYTSEEAGVLRT
jgi:beta-aspartyl-peptidase (threonine type)